jgi:hypothetical protein
MKDEGRRMNLHLSFHPPSPILHPLMCYECNIVGARALCIEENLCRLCLENIGIICLRLK